MPTLSKLSKLAFHSEPAAFEYLETTLWPHGVVCPHCGTVGHATKLQTNGEARRASVGPDRPLEMQREGMPQAIHGQSRDRFRAWPHSPPQDASSGLPLCCSKKGCSSHQLHRILGITYKAAWFLSHRIREAMRDGSLAPIGGGGKIVEADETFFVNKKGFPKQSGVGHKMVVVSLVERGGQLRSTVIDAVSQP